MKIIYITCKDEKEAIKIGNVLIGEKLAACVNIIPGIKSIYKWKGRVCEDSESILLVKTLNNNAGHVINKVKEIHSYEIPCIEIIDVDSGNEDYFNWVRKEVNLNYKNLIKNKK